MANDRHAGRKAKLSKEEIEEIIRRRAAGESVSGLAKEYGISRQALYNCIKEAELPAESRIDYVVDGELCSSIFVDRKRQTIRLIHYTVELSKRAFGINDSPTINDLNELLKEQYFKLKGVRYYDQMLMIDNGPETGDNIENCLGSFGSAKDDNNTVYEHKDRAGGSRYPDDVSGEALIFRDNLFVPKFNFAKDDRVIRRTDTDGFQMKAITRDRRHFVKSQAVMAGVRLRDWAVEIIASDICARFILLASAASFTESYLAISSPSFVN